jgi:hypothetical protein
LKYSIIHMYRFVLNFPYPLTPFSDKSYLVRWSLKPGFPFLYVFYVVRGLYIGKDPPPRGGGGISADVIWGKKYEKWKRKRRKM